MKQITRIKSDTLPNLEYVITLNNGLATHCTCLGFFYGYRCKHLYRAENKQAFLKAMNFLCSIIPQDSFLNLFNAAVKSFGGKTNNQAVNKAIQSILNLVPEDILYIEKPHTK